MLMNHRVDLLGPFTQLLQLITSDEELKESLTKIAPASATTPSSRSITEDDLSKVSSNEINIFLIF